MAQETKILRLTNVMKKVGLSRSSVYMMMKKGDFPRPIKLGERSVGWVEKEIDDWLQKKIASR